MGKHVLLTIEISFKQSIYIYLWHVFMVLFSVMMCHDVSSKVLEPFALICFSDLWTGTYIWQRCATVPLFSFGSDLGFNQISEIVTAASAASHIFTIFSLCDGVRNVFCNVL